MDLWSLPENDQAQSQLRALTEQRRSWLDRKPFREIQALWPRLPAAGQVATDYRGSAPIIGPEMADDHPDRQVIEAAARAVMPWKKGPFRLCGIDIDAEWRSDKKWDRMVKHLPNQKDKIVLDVGCNNGYYLFRLLPQRPRYLLGIDPVPRLHYQFHLLQHFAQEPRLAFQMWGWQELGYFRNAFDTLFCMGILYHHADPIGLLRTLITALKPGGLLVLETIVIPGEDDTCLFPKERYARMRNVWFVPTLSAMSHMLERTRFTDIETIATNKHEPAEQRTTAWNPGPSYAEFIQPTDPERTVEGYLAPHRAILFAHKKD